MKFGAEPKKVAILGVLLAVGGYFFYANVISDSNDDHPHQPPPSSASKKLGEALDVTTPAVPAAPAGRGPVVRSTSRSKTSEEFHPSMKRKPEDAIDPTSIDPTLRLDLLAKVQSQDFAIAGRNPFQFGQPPPPPVPKAPPVDPKALLAAKKEPSKTVDTPKVDSGPPKPPPLNLSWKYYGYTVPRGSAQKRVFFLDGEDILTANEGDVLKKKYKVVRIGVNSVVMEDVDTKSQQTLPLAEEAVG
jgi:hypothetical protein